MYAEVNGKLNYNKGLNSSSNNYPRFDKRTQSLNNNVMDDNYYCGGKSSLALRGMQMNNTPVSIAYFSNKNIARIQKYIKREIFKRSHGEYILEMDQDENDLILVMRAVFFEYSRHLPTNVDEQVRELNRYTLREIIPGMMTNIEQQMLYLRDISQPIQPIALPLNVNNGGRRNLPSVTSLW
jgi:hypothetical protein